MSIQNELIKERIALTGLTNEMWTEDHMVRIDQFVTNGDKILVAYMDNVNGFVVGLTMPPTTVKQLVYFVKRDETEVTAETFTKVVQYGTVMGGHIESLLRLMMGIYAPIYFDNKSWPDSIKNEFSAQLHKFLASLTDTRWKMEGKTVLYIPNERNKLESKEAFKDKELVQRLESE